MIYLVDWLTFTSKAHSKDSIIEFLGLSELKWMDSKPQNGYHFGVFSNDIHINWGGNNDTVCVNFSGKGCRSFESNSNLDWLELFAFFSSDDDFNVTRLDVACDEQEGILPLERIAQISNKFISGDTSNICTKLTWCQVANSSAGLSIYYGSPKSNFRIRFYDKARERGIVDGSHWVRCEMQIRGKNCIGMIRSILSLGDIGKSFTGVLNNYLRFIKRDNINISRCSNLQWWGRFIRTADKVKIFSRVGVEYNFYHIENWLDKQVGNSLQTYIACCRGDISGLLDIATKPRDLSRKQKDLIAKYESEYESSCMKSP